MCVRAHVPLSIAMNIQNSEVQISSAESVSFGTEFSFPTLLTDGKVFNFEADYNEIVSLVRVCSRQVDKDDWILIRVYFNVKRSHVKQLFVLKLVYSLPEFTVTRFIYNIKRFLKTGLFWI